MKLVQLLLLPLITLSSAAPAALHFGAGVGYYDDQYLYYNDQGYYQNFSSDLGVYSDFDDSHMVFLDIHLYSELATTTSGVTAIVYAGIGGIFVHNSDNYTDQNYPNESEENWGIRLPIGIELMTTYDIAVFAEVLPTYIVISRAHYESTASFGIRYYFY